MTEPTFHTTFTLTCQTCGGTVQVTDGVRDPHPCPESPSLVIEGCGHSVDDLVTRVTRALDDFERLDADGVRSP